MTDTEKEVLCARIDELCAEVEALKREKPRTMLSVTARHVAELQAENAKLRELLQYVADNHLCGTWLIDRMRELGIEVK